MRLLNHTLKYLSIALFLIVSIWAVIFYFNMLDEVYDSIDDGLENNKMLIIQKAQEDTLVLRRNAFAEGNYVIREIDMDVALAIKDTYKDSLMFMLSEEDFEPVRLLTTAFERQGSYYELKVISSMVEEDDLIEDLLYAIIWLYVVLIASIVLLNNVLLKKVWKPFYLLLDQLKNFRLGKDALITPAKTNVKEFQVLNEAVTSLLQHTLETYNSQKQFIENASHELQTPLAISINKLELLAEKNELDGESMETIGQVIRMLERLTRLNKSLLLLSRIENKQFLQQENVHINEIVQRLVSEFSHFADYRDVTLRYREEAQLYGHLNKDLAEILVSNLLKNAIVHNTAGGEVEIVVTAAQLTISNSGKPVSLEKELIFGRFHKNTDDVNATGLGLAIVKAITDTYGISTGYAFRDGRHVMSLHF